MIQANVKEATILIIDDQQDNIDLLEVFLADDGYTQIHSTCDPRQACFLFEGVRPDLILLDLHMPHLDGFTVLNDLLAATPPSTFLPIVALTADVSTHVKQQALASGAHDFLVKPLDEVEVLLRIRNLLETRRLHLQIQANIQVMEEKIREVAQERELAERLLLNVLPKPIAERLKHDQRIIADHFPEAAVLFADIENFTMRAAEIGPDALVERLNTIFSAFDFLVEQHGLEKIKTIGDAYMAVAGVPTSSPDPTAAAADLALAMQAAMARAARDDGEPLRLRIGIHTGPVVAGVIGTWKFSYDLWGDTVNTASRMESHGLPDRIQVTAAVYERLKDRYRFEARGLVEIKGKGEMYTYLLTGRTA